MKLSCILGFHKWKPHYRPLSKPETVPIPKLVWPSLFVGPPYFKDSGMAITVTRKIVYRKCTECGKKE